MRPEGPGHKDFCARPFCAIDPERVGVEQPLHPIVPGAPLRSVLRWWSGIPLDNFLDGRIPLKKFGGLDAENPFAEVAG